MEPVGENEATEAPPFIPKDGYGGSGKTQGASSTPMLQGDGDMPGVVVRIGQAQPRRDSSRLGKRDSAGSVYGTRNYSGAGGGAGGRRWSESSNHSSMTTSRRISAVGTIFESPHITVGTQIVLVAPAFLYAIAVLMWLFEDQDIEFARELAPVSFAALCVHLFAAGEIPYLTFWEVVHYWFHAACEVLVANDYTRKIGTRHLNYSLGTLYVLWMLFRHLTGSNAKQVMLFRLRHHQSYAVVFSFLSTVYSLYEYAAMGIPYTNNTSELMADLVIFVCWFLSIVTIINAAPREHTPAIMYLSTVIPDPTLQIESLEVAPDGAFTENDRRRLSLGPLSRDRGPLGRMLRDTGRPVSLPSGARPEGSGPSPRDPTIAFSHQGNWMERSGSLHGELAEDGGDKKRLGFGERRGASEEGARSIRPRSSANNRSTGMLSPYEETSEGEGENDKPEDSVEDVSSSGDAQDDPDEYTHPLLKYYRMHGRIPPLSFFNTYLCEIVFFWRFMLFTFTVGYKLFLSLAAYYIMNRHWAQIFTPLSTSALTVSWLLTLGCDPRDRVSNQMMNVHFWFHALSEIPDIIVWIKNGQHVEAILTDVDVDIDVDIDIDAVSASTRSCLGHCESGVGFDNGVGIDSVPM
eukprot:jgi/Undpi1/9801/HiC_scaffold_27.g12255.m1